MKWKFSPTLAAWIILATSTLVFPLTDCPLTAVSSSPLWRVPSLLAAVLSKIWTIYRQGQSGAPPPMLIPMRLFESFLTVTLPDVTVIPLERMCSVRQSGQNDRRSS